MFTFLKPTKLKSALKDIKKGNPFHCIKVDDARDAKRLEYKMKDLGYKIRFDQGMEQVYYSKTLNMYIGTTSNSDGDKYIVNAKELIKDDK